MKDRKGGKAEQANYYNSTYKPWKDRYLDATSSIPRQYWSGKKLWMVCSTLDGWQQSETVGNLWPSKSKTRKEGRNSSNAPIYPPGPIHEKGKHIDAATQPNQTHPVSIKIGQDFSCFFTSSTATSFTVLLPRSQPPTGGMQNGSSVGTSTHRIHVFFAHIWHPICMFSRCLVTKFLHRSSVGSLLRVCCRLGSLSLSLPPSTSAFCSSPLCWRKKKFATCHCLPFSPLFFLLLLLRL